MQAIESVRSQTYQKIEIIVVDDGSTDSTPEVVKRLGSEVKLLRQGNRGPSSARNAGVKASRGQIVAFLDSDDIWMPRKIQSQVEFLEAFEERLICCVCNARVVNPVDGERTSFESTGIGMERGFCVWSNPTEVLLTRFLLFNQVVALPREAFNEAVGFRESLSLMEDYDLALRLSIKGPWGLIGDELVIKDNGTDGIGVQAMKNSNAMAKARLRALEFFWKEHANRSTSASLRKTARFSLLIAKCEARVTRAQAAGFASGGIYSGMWRRFFQFFHAAVRRLPGYPQPDIEMVNILGKEQFIFNAGRATGGG